MNNHKFAFTAASGSATVLLLAACLFCVALVAPVSVTVGAQSSCVYVRVVNGLTANVRSGAGADFPTVANSINYASGEKLSCENANGWYRISDPVGWVSSTYSGGLKLLNIRAVSVIPSPTATRTATVPPRTATATPSRQPSSTTGPTPTATATPSEPEVIVYTYEDGYIVIDGFCPRACLWSIRMENAPE